MKFLKSDIWAKVLFLLLLVVSIINHVLISYTQKEPYMDEEFHIPQTQEYCNGHFSKWDNKITTLPGLYMIPTVVSILLGSHFQCTTVTLRSINLFITMCMFWVFYYLLGAKRPETTKKWRAFMSYTLTMFPLNYFFTFLYYTDQLSTVLVLIMLYFVYKKSFKLSALAGLYAVFTRQTNIIWVLWTTIIISWDLLQVDLPKWIKLIISKPKSTGKNSQSNVHGRSRQNSSKKMSFVENNILFWSECIVKIAPRVMPYAIIMLSFVGFLIINQGIVVGDRTAHQASLNFPQMFYFSFFVGFMLSPLMILFGLHDTFIKIRKHSILFVSMVILGLIIVNLNTIVHPYLLADNRHYTFYIWKRFYEWYPIVRYFLVPCYVIIWFWIWTSVKFHPVLFLGFLFCLAASIVPQKLLEYRYFIIPYYILRMEMKYMDWKHLIPEAIFHILINIFTIYQFIVNPFVLEGQTVISRFMW